MKIGNCASLNNPVYDCANEESSHSHTNEHFQDISNGKYYNIDNIIFMHELLNYYSLYYLQTAGHSSTWNNPTYDSTLSNDGRSFGIDTENNAEAIYYEPS